MQIQAPGPMSLSPAGTSESGPLDERDIADRLALAFRTAPLFLERPFSHEDRSIGFGWEAEVAAAQLRRECGAACLGMSVWVGAGWWVGGGSPARFVRFGLRSGCVW